MAVVSRAKQFGRDLTARAIAPVLRRLAHDPTYFELWERYGFHVTGSHFYQPIPNTGGLPLSLWNRVSDLPGIDGLDRRGSSRLRSSGPPARRPDRLVGAARLRTACLGARLSGCQKRSATDRRKRLEDDRENQRRRLDRSNGYSHRFRSWFRAKHIGH